MKPTQLLFAFVTLVLAAGGVAADDNEQRCQQLEQDVKAKFEESMKARLPKEDPGTFNQNNYDIKSLLAQDTGAGFGKLQQFLGGNFSGALQSFVDGAVQQAVAKGQEAFGSKMRSVLSDFGMQLPANQFQQALTTTTSGVGSRLQQAFGSAASGLLPGTGATAPATAAPAAAAVQQAPTMWSPYGNVRR